MQNLKALCVGVLASDEIQKFNAYYFVVQNAVHKLLKIKMGQLTRWGP